MRLRPASYLAVTAFLVANPAVANAAQFDAGPTGPDQIDAWGKENHSIEVHGTGSGIRVSFDPKDPRNDPANYLMDVQLRFDATLGGSCVQVGQRFVVGAGNSRAALDAEARVLRLLRNYPLCSRSAPVPARLSAGAVALALWRDQVKLPPPAPRIAPGWGIVGKEAYLEIGGAREP